MARQRKTAPPPRMPPRKPKARATAHTTFRLQEGTLTQLDALAAALGLGDGGRTECLRRLIDREAKRVLGGRAPEASPPRKPGRPKKVPQNGAG